ARKADGLLMFAGMNAVAPTGRIEWGVFGAPVQADPGMLVIWERFEDAELLHAAAVDVGGALRARSGGYQAQPARIEPTPSTWHIVPFPIAVPLADLPG